jgi:hypothetical protein
MRCKFCEEEIEHNPKVGWVEVNEDGFYDLCPDNPMGDQEGHVPA